MTTNSVDEWIGYHCEVSISKSETMVKVCFLVSKNAWQKDADFGDKVHL